MTKKEIFLMLLIFLFTLISCNGQEKKPVGEFDKNAIELNNTAIKLSTEQKCDSALVLLDKAIEIDPNNYLFHSNKANIYCQLKKFQEASSEVDKAIKIKPDLAEGWTIGGMLFDIQGDSVKAKEYYQKSIEIFDKRILDPEKKKFILANRLGRAVSLILSGKEQEGRSELKKIKKENPNDQTTDMFLETTKKEIINQIFGLDDEPITE